MAYPLSHRAPRIPNLCSCGFVGDSITMTPAARRSDDILKFAQYLAYKYLSSCPHAHHSLRMSSSTAPSDGTNVNERTSLLDAGQQGQRKPTPLPKLQISILLLVQLLEPIASQSIYPYINQVGIFATSKFRFIHWKHVACE
jgi:hypothetical protein